MAFVLPPLSPIWRQSLRIWLASTLTSGIVLWSGRGGVLAVALVLAVLLVNENDLTPARSLGQLVAGVLIGILTAFVLHELSTSWVVLGLALLLTGLLIRALGLLKGLSMGYTGCWALDIVHQGNQVNWAVITDLAFAAVVGILMAQFATWALWPRHPLQQLPALEAGIAAQLAQQVGAMQHWLEQGGAPPPPLLAGSLRLTVGYGVCCIVVVMGWLSHDQQLDSWIPLRLLWTAFGILMALLSLRLFWPSRARIQQRQGLLQLLVDLGHTLQQAVEQSQPRQQRRRSLSAQLRQLRSTLQQLREQRQSALLELGSRASQHPVARMWELLDQACEALILDLDELRRLPLADWRAWGLQELDAAGVGYMQAVGQRLLRWQEQLHQSLQLQPPPQEPRQALPLEALQTAEAQAAYGRLSPEQLQRVAAQLMVLNRIAHTLESTEEEWQALVS